MYPHKWVTQREYLLSGEYIHAGDPDGQIIIWEKNLGSLGELGQRTELQHMSKDQATPSR